MLTLEQASKKVKDYFQEVKGMNLALLGFDIGPITKDAAGWTIECEFNSAPFSNARVKYRVKIDNHDQIASVDKI